MHEYYYDLYTSNSYFSTTTVAQNTTDVINEKLT